MKDQQIGPVSSTEKTQDQRSATSTTGDNVNEPAPAVFADGDESVASSAAATRRRSAHNLDVVNAGTMDSSVDTDGKSSDARRDLPAWRDNVVGSNASLDDSVDTPAEGLAGIDSRAAGNRPQIAAGIDYQVDYLGAVAVSSDGYDGGDMTRASGIDAETEACDVDHQPAGREHIAQVIRITKKKS